MSLQERRPDPSGPNPGSAPSGGGGANLEGLRRASQSVISAARSALARAMSADHEAFNRSARITGAQ